MGGCEKCIGQTWDNVDKGTSSVRGEHGLGNHLVDLSFHTVVADELAQHPGH